MSDSSAVGSRKQTRSLVANSSSEVEMTELESPITEYASMKGSKEDTPPFRIIQLNDKEANLRFQKKPSTKVKRIAKNNYVSTGKYNVLSFIPLTLFEFFRVVANCYFLFISILQQFPAINPESNTYNTYGVLSVIFLVFITKQGVEDWKRHKADRITNNRRVVVLKDGEDVETQSKFIQMGDIIKISKRESVPADVVILATSEEEGVCFVETSNLDGETNLKRKVAVKSTSEAVGMRAVGAPPLDVAAVREAVCGLRGSVKYEDKNNQLYLFTGLLSCVWGGAGEKWCPVEPFNILLRGCSLRR
jgi:magnesium-transporting ATPase (P-type)